MRARLASLRFGTDVLRDPFPDLDEPPLLWGVLPAHGRRIVDESADDRRPPSRRNAAVKRFGSLDHEIELLRMSGRVAREIWAAFERRQDRGRPVGVEHEVPAAEDRGVHRDDKLARTFRSKLTGAPGDNRP